MIPSISALAQTSFSSITIGGTTTHGIQQTVTSGNPTYLVTNGAVYGATQALDTRITAIEGDDLDNRVTTLEGYDADNRLNTLEGYDCDTRLNTLEGHIDQDVLTTSTPTFEGLILNGSNLRCNIVQSVSNATWWQIIADILDDGDGKFATIHLYGRTFNSFKPTELVYHIARQPLSYGSAFLMNYEASDPDPTTYPRFVAYRNPANGVIRIYTQPEVPSRYSLFVTGNEFTNGIIQQHGTGTLPDNIDGTWVVEVDTDAGLPGPRTNPPNTFKQVGRIYLTSTAIAPAYAIETYGPCYFGSDVVCNGTLSTNHLKPSGLDSIDTYEIGSGTVNITGPFSTTAAYRYHKLNSAITLRIVGVTGTSTATTFFTITIPVAITTSVSNTNVVNITDGAQKDFGAAITNGTTIKVYTDGNGGLFTSGLTAAFDTFTITYFSS